MKKLFGMLLLANVAVFVYFNQEVWAPKASQTLPELHAEKLKLMKESDLASLPVRVAPQMTENISSEATIVAPAAPPLLQTTLAEASKCYDWGSFANTTLNQAIDEASKLGIQHSVQALDNGNDNKRYWIYKPPLATPEAAQAKAEELRKLGLDDFFIIQDAKWRNAISFGVFKDETLADALMEKIKEKGVRLVVKAIQFVGEGRAMLKLQHVSKSQLETLKKSQPQFAEVEFKEIACQ